MTEKRAKLFRNGGSQAVRLPKEFQFAGGEVAIRREGKKVVLEAVGPRTGAGDLDAARKAIKMLGPLDPDFAATVEEAMRKLQEN